MCQRDELSSTADNGLRLCRILDAIGALWTWDFSHNGDPMSGARGRRRLRDVPAAAEPALPRLPGRARQGAPRSSSGRPLGAETRSARPPRRWRDAASGRPWPRRWPASRRSAAPRKPRSARDRLRRRARSRSSPASRPASSAARSSCCTRRSPPRSRPRSASRRSARPPVVPVFWVASDDHDFAEVRSATVLDASGALRTLRYAPREEPPGQPASQHHCSTRRIGAPRRRAARARCLQRSHRDAALRDRRVAATAPGADAELGLRAPGVARCSPSSSSSIPPMPSSSGCWSPFSRASSSRARPRSQLALEAGRALLEAGYHQQVPVRPGFLNVFVVDGRPAPRAGDARTAPSRCGARRAQVPSPTPRRASRATRAPGARARSCVRWRRTRCCPPLPTSAGRPRSRTTRRSARPTRTSASRGRCCCRGRA